MVEPVNDNILNLVNELYNNLDAKDKIINEQALEIANLNKRLENEQKVAEEYLRLEDDYELLYNENEHLKEEISKLKDDKKRAREYIKESCVYDEDDGYEEKIYSLYVPTLLEILGDKENE